MPAIIGSIQIWNVTGGAINFGDSLNVSPKSNSKTNQGSGSGNSGAIVITNNGLSATHSKDPDVVDQPMKKNA